ncbi:MAG: hypothetical protein JSV39_03760 [Candidatus Aenigmatarchaeota archaeon]|nr:MAG: hypothetical protein JSV39_03760 [Candidatus Aenigmarchaeota archaeon]
MFKVKIRGLTFIIDCFKRFNFLVVKTINKILLSLVYFVGIGATSLLGKILRKKFLDINPKRKETCWIEIEDKEKTGEDYKRMF